MSLTKTQGGFVNTLFVSLIAVSVLLLGAIGFGVWAFVERQDYKSNSDQKAAAASEKTKEETQVADAAKYAEEAKNPLKTFVGPSAFGSVTLQYPKTWSGYIIQDGQGSKPLDGFFHPDVVPNISNDEHSFALRTEILEDSYDQVLSDFDGAAEKGEVKVSPYKLPKVAGVVGSRIDGQLDNTKRGSMIIFPLRNVTLKVWTESEQYLPDFETFILPNLSFSP